MNATELTHDDVYALACQMDAVDLACYQFDTVDTSGCNGIWAVAETAIDLDHARVSIGLLMRGQCPEGIETANETSATWLASRRDD